MRTLTIDIETYSEVDIGSCGAYRYVDDPSFEVLLFAYSFDYDTAKVVDLMCGEQIPQEVMDALWDENVLKTAYNAPFERTCLAKHFGRPMPPEQWECDMVLGAVCGLPLGLANVSNALGLSEDKAKMKEGKDLIRYFCLPCKPTKTNGNRTRNLPEHAPDKWEVFKEYCRRDVEAENEVRKKLVKYRPDEDEHRNWCLDQKINDTGVLIDLNVVENAIKFDNLAKQELLEEAINLTALDNPKSVSQIKTWLEESEGLVIDSLNKKAMPDVLANLKTDTAKRVLDLRNELSKTSVKKFESMMRCVCADGRARGLFQFYGTRTGRFCLAEGSMILIKDINGSVYEKPIEDVTTDDLVWDGESWVEHEGVVYSGNKDVIEWDGVIATPEHKVWVNATDKVTLQYAKDNKIKLWTGDEQPCIQSTK